MFRVIRAGDDLQAKRRRIIHDLNAKIQLLKIDATLVFDSQFQYGETTRGHFNHLEILFSSEGQTADELILNELKIAKTPVEHTVVTSDKKLAWQARRRCAKTETVEKFLEWLNKRYKNELRRLKYPTPSRKEQALKVVEKLQSAQESKKSVPPTSGDFDYYLKVFEKKLEEELSSEVNIKEKSTSKKLKKMKIKKVEDEHYSDMQRWLNAFEKGLSDHH